MAVTVQPEAVSLGDDFVAAAERALNSGQLGQVSDADLERVLTAAVRLYAAKTEADAPPAQPITPDLEWLSGQGTAIYRAGEGGTTSAGGVP